MAIRASPASTCSISDGRLITGAAPHYHPIDRVVMVMGGTMWIGTGPSGDKTRTVGGAKGRIHPRHRARYPLRRVGERSDVDSHGRCRAHGDYQCRPAEVALRRKVPCDLLQHPLIDDAGVAFVGLVFE